MAAVRRQKDEAAGRGGHAYSKGQLMAAERFRGRRDVVDALLSPDGEYTAEAVEEMIGEYMKGKVE